MTTQSKIIISTRASGKLAQFVLRKTQKAFFPRGRTNIAIQSTQIIQQNLRKIAKTPSIWRFQAAILVFINYYRLKLGKV